MTNEEKYIDTIIEVRKYGGLALNKETGLPCDCNRIGCSNCSWQNKDCLEEEMKWLRQEYEESDATVCDSRRLDDAIDKQIISDSIAHYGAEIEATVCTEECGELVQAICKMKRGKPNRDNLIEEIADVLISIELLKQIYSISDSEIAKWVKYKQAREVERMQEDK